MRWLCVLPLLCTACTSIPETLHEYTEQIGMISDCSLQGQSAIYRLVEGRYVPGKSTALTAERIPLTKNSYYIRVRDQKNNTSAFYIPGGLGSFDFAAPDRSIECTGVCVRQGHCEGSLRPDDQRFSLDFTKGHIHLVTFEENGSFVDTLLDGACK